MDEIKWFARGLTWDIQRFHGQAGFDVKFDSILISHHLDVSNCDATRARVASQLLISRWTLQKSVIQRPK